jgi:hypothetical protein
MESIKAVNGMLLQPLPAGGRTTQKDYTRLQEVIAVAIIFAGWKRYAVTVKQSL